MLYNSVWLINNFIFPGVTGVCMDGESVSVEEGESVTLDTNVKVNQHQRIIWSFSDVRVAEITGDLSFICTGVQCKGSDGKISNRLKLDSQTGSLTIKDSRIADSGVYKLQINNESRQTEKIFIVTVHGESLFKLPYSTGLSNT